ncbi:MAG: hypothetical protein LBJ64_03635 [Deltaproteobacteria bacterium]|jgi:hypothetical protein|nr:hypothetical protein [Deltaproteobacteria bacterium]
MYFDILNNITMDKDEYFTYLSRLKYKMDRESARLAWLEKGEKKGLKKGLKKGREMG